MQVARQKRLAAQQARIQKQLQEKMDRDRAEEQKREAQHDHRLVHRERIEAWKSGKKVPFAHHWLSTSIQSFTAPYQGS